MQFTRHDVCCAVHTWAWLNTESVVCMTVDWYNYMRQTISHSHSLPQRDQRSLAHPIHTHTHTGILTRTQSLSIYPVNLSRTLYTSVRAVPKKTIHIENAHEHSSCQQRERETEHTACGRKTNGKAMWWWWSIVIVVCVYQVNVFLSRGQRLSNQMSRFQIST